MLRAKRKRCRGCDVITLEKRNSISLKGTNYLPSITSGTTAIQWYTDNTVHRTTITAQLHRHTIKSSSSSPLVFNLLPVNTSFSYFEYQVK